jgi:hypothetical protein
MEEVQYLTGFHGSWFLKYFWLQRLPEEDKGSRKESST